MKSPLFAEDAFLQFYDLVARNRINIQHQDVSPIQSFKNKLDEKSNLTKNQANYVLKILDKYKSLSALAGFDYRNDLAELEWRLPFRVLDLSKSIYVEKSENGRIDVCLKFPFQLKKEFDEEINNSKYQVLSSRWDPDDKVRRLNVYDFNLISLYEFAIKHNFQIDESFMSVLADVEEIWQNSEDILPYSELTDSGVVLKNASEETIEWWNNYHTETLETDLLIAKSMGYVLKKNPENIVEKIATHQENSFWIKDKEQFFYLYKKISGKVCIILDRTSDTLKWLQNFVDHADKNGVSRDEIKVCFRESKDSKTGINDWIKLAGVGGKVETGKILIFESKPAKWLFKGEQDVKMLVTNNIYPPTNTLARDWFNSHPCVIYLGETKPTEQKGQKIVEL